MSAPKLPGSYRNTNQGVNRTVVKNRMGSAMVFREKFPAEIIGDYYEMILRGKVPMIVTDERCTTTNGLKVVEDVGKSPPTLDQRMTALARVHERRDGMPAQSVHVEAELRAQVEAIGVLSSQEMGTLPPAAIDLLYSLISGKAKPKYLDDPNVVDAEVVSETREEK